MRACVLLRVPACVCACVHARVCARVHASLCVCSGTCVCAHMFAHVCLCVCILLFELAETGGIMIIQRNNKNGGKHLFSIGNISVSCSNFFLSNKVYEVYESIEKYN